MGDEVLNLNLSKSADAIVFIRGEGKKLTGGKTAFMVMVGGTPAYLKLQIGMVDTRSGEVLFIRILFWLVIRLLRSIDCESHWRKDSRNYRVLLLSN